MRRRRACLALCAVLAALPGCVGGLAPPHDMRGNDRHGWETDSGHAARRMPPPAWHVQRNRRNLCPRLEPVPGTADCMGLTWMRDDLLMAWYFHGDGWLGARHATYRSAEPGGAGGYQCTYDRDGALITAGAERGTYDYVRPNASLVGHRDRDLRPHQRWPDAYEDPDRTWVYGGEACRIARGGS